MIFKRAFFFHALLMAVIGITGGIATGKTTFTAMLSEKLTADVFDADVAARDLLENDEQVRKMIKKEISDRAYDLNGKPDRKEIRRIIYNDLSAKARLEAILHPRIRTKWTQQAKDPAYRIGYLIVDIPLLFETNAELYFDSTITVACSESVQWERVCARGIEPVLAKKIIQSQLPISEKISRSHHVVWNDGTPAILQAQADILANIILKKDF